MESLDKWMEIKENAPEEDYETKLARLEEARWGFVRLGMQYSLERWREDYFREALKFRRLFFPVDVCDLQIRARIIPILKELIPADTDKCKVDFWWDDNYDLNVKLVRV